MRTRKQVESIKKEAKRLENLAMKCQQRRAKLTEQTNKMRDDLLGLQKDLASIIVGLNVLLD